MLACLIIGCVPSLASADAGIPRNLQPHEIELLARAAAPGGVRVLVTLNTSIDTTSALTPLTERGRRDVIAASQADFAAKLKGLNTQVIRTYNAFPILLLNVDKPALQHILTLAEVRGIQEDHLSLPLDNANDTVMETSVAWGFGFTGSGHVVAVLDTGVQENHPFLSTGGVTSRVIASLEGCFSGDSGAVSNVYSFCPGGVYSETGDPAGHLDGTPCSASYAGCEHGTHIAGIAAGSGAYPGGNYENGVAIASNIMPVQVYSCYYNGSTCIVAAYDSDVIAGLNWVHDRWTNSPYFIEAALITFGVPGTDYTSNCDGLASAYKTAIDTLRNSDGIPTIIASGNNGFTDGVGYPACVSSAITVASTDNLDNVSSFTDTANFVSLYAPGENVLSSIPTSAYAYLTGTSMAAAQVAGVFTLMQQIYGHAASVSKLLTILQASGKPITARGYTLSRVDIGKAIVIFKDGFGG